MAGTDTLPPSQTNSLVSSQPCHLRAHRRKLFDELLALRLIPELLAATVWARTEFDLNILIDLFRLMPESARMSTMMLYLQDLSTKLAQDRGSIGASEEGSHVDDPHATHRQLLSLRWTILLLTAFFRVLAKRLLGCRSRLQ